MHGMDLIVYFMSLQLLPSFNSVTGRQCEYYIDSTNIGACQTGTTEIKRETRSQLSSCNIPFFSFFFWWWWWWWYAEESNLLEWNFNQYIPNKESGALIYAGNWQINTVLISWFNEYSIQAWLKIALRSFTDNFFLSELWR